MKILAEALDALFRIRRRRKLVLACALAFLCSPARSQTSELSFLWAYTTAANSTDGWAVADLRAHILRDALGAIDSGSIDCRIDFDVPAPVQVTALRIHRKTDSGAGPLIFQVVYQPPLTI